MKYVGDLDAVLENHLHIHRTLVNIRPSQLDLQLSVLHVYYPIYDVARGSHITRSHKFLVLIKDFIHHPRTTVLDGAHHHFRPCITHYHHVRPLLAPLHILRQHRPRTMDGGQRHRI